MASLLVSRLLCLFIYTCILKWSSMSKENTCLEQIEFTLILKAKLILNDTINISDFYIFLSILRRLWQSLLLAPFLFFECSIPYPYRCISETSITLAFPTFWMQNSVHGFLSLGALWKLSHVMQLWGGKGIGVFDKLADTEPQFMSYHQAGECIMKAMVPLQETLFWG